MPTYNFVIKDALSRSMTNLMSMLTSSKTAIWNTSQIAFLQQSLLIKEYILLHMIRNKIFKHFPKPLCLILTQMHGENVDGISFFVQHKHKTLSDHYKRLFSSIETILQW